jgi:hypothetical protein
VTLLFAVLHLAVVLLIFLVATAWGYRVLEMLKCEAQNNLEAVLFASGLSFATLAIVLFFLAFAGWLRFGSAVVALALMAISAGRGWRHLCSASRDLLASLRPSSLPMSEPIVLLLIAAFLAIGGLLAMAPLSGSDSMHYHFTAPLLEQGRPLAPIYWMVHGFFIGQAHLVLGFESQEAFLERTVPTTGPLSSLTERCRRGPAHRATER